MRYLIILLAMSAAIGFTACGKKSGNTIAAPPPTSDGGAVNPGTGALGGCQVGQYYHQQYGCLNQQQCVGGYGFVPSINQCVPAQLVRFQDYYGVQGKRWGYSLTITNPTQLALMAKEHGRFCDTNGLQKLPNTLYFQWNLFEPKCIDFVNRGAFVIVEAPGADATQANITVAVGAWSPSTRYDSLSWYYPNQGSQYVPMQFPSATVHPINDSTGIEIRANGQWYGHNYVGDGGLWVRVDNGSLALNKMMAEFFYKGVKFGQAPIELY